MTMLQRFLEQGLPFEYAVMNTVLFCVLENDITNKRFWLLLSTCADGLFSRVSAPAENDTSAIESAAALVDKHSTYVPLSKVRISRYHLRGFAVADR
jgi:hypothetical protein